MVFLFDWKNLEAYFRRRADVSVKKVFLQILQNSQENTCVKVSFLIKLLACNCLTQVYNFIIKEAPTQEFSCEFSEIFKNTHFEEYLRTTASVKLPIAITTIYSSFG